MMDERKNKKIYIIYAVIIIAMVFKCGRSYYLSVQRDKEEQKAQEQYEEEKRLRIQAYEEAEKYVQKYAASLQDDMRQLGLDDMTVTYCTCSVESFDSFYGTKAGEEADYAQYYVVSFASDHIDEIYKANVRQGDLESFTQLLNEERKAKNSAYESTYHKQEIHMGNRNIEVYIGDNCRDVGLLVKGGSGSMYKLYLTDGETRLFLNEKEVNIESPPEENNQSGSGSSGRRNDPYDVYDYDDPDDFADEWAEEFGDGDYDDGYDDAYAYWEEAWGWW